MESNDSNSYHGNENHIFETKVLIPEVANYKYKDSNKEICSNCS